MRNTVTGKLRYLLYAMLMFALTGCGASNLANLANLAKNDGATTGSVTAKTVLGDSKTAKRVDSAPAEITSVQVTVTGTDNNGAAIPVVRGAMDLATNQGTINGIYPGTVTLAVKALNGNVVAYEGFAVGVVVNGGATTTLAAPIVLSPPVEKAQDKGCIACHETTLDSTGQNLVAEFKQSGHYTNSSWTDNVKFPGVVGTGCASCHGPAHNDVNPATGRCAECHVATVTGSHSSAAFLNATNHGVCSACHNSHNPSGPFAGGIQAKFATTATPYVPQQGVASHEKAPAGYSPVFTEAVVRHGSRGMSSFDATVYNMLQKAAADGALTPLGLKLVPDVWKMMSANALLGFGVAGITAPGYGNLSQVGIGEHQQIAARLYQRLPGYFAQVAASRLTATPRQIVYSTSGVNRATDSAGFFTQSLMANYSSLKPLVVKAPALTAYPVNKPAAQAAGVNRFLLYFHKLAAKTDLVTDPADSYYQTYQDSLTYQAYLKNANLVAKVNAMLNSADAKSNARAVLLGLFSPDFVNKIDNGTYTFANSGTLTFTSSDGRYTSTLSGDGSTTVQSLTDAASALYSFYTIAPAMKVELGNLDFTQYIPDAQASYLAYLDDVQSFYQKGPGITEDSPATFKMAQILENDFFNEIDAIAKGNLAHGASLRFTHGEEIMPFAAILGLPNGSVSVANASNYTYANNPWRGSEVSPLAANVQWDVYSNGNGSLLVRMLYNEKDTDFKPACDSARHAPDSHFYDYAGLKACYGHVAN
jgi:hypothetical protein